MELLLAFWKTFVAWFPDVYKTMFAFALICGCLLFFPWDWLRAMHVESFAASYRPLEWLIFGLGSILLVLHWGDIGIARFKKGHFLADRLTRLSTNEAHTIRRLLKGDSVIAWPYEDRVIYLHNEGILKRKRSEFPS